MHSLFYHYTRTRSTIGTTRSFPRTSRTSCTSPCSPSRQAAPSRITLACKPAEWRKPAHDNSHCLCVCCVCTFVCVVFVRLCGLCMYVCVCCVCTFGSLSVSFVCVSFFLYQARLHQFVIVTSRQSKLSAKERQLARLDHPSSLNERRPVMMRTLHPRRQPTSWFFVSANQRPQNSARVVPKC